MRSEQLSAVTFRKHALFVLVVGVGFGLRLLGLWDREPWNDEVWTLDATRNYSYLELVVDTFSTAQMKPTPHPPLFHLVTKTWGSVGGYSVGSLRVVSVIFSCATIVVVYVICVDLYDRKTGLVSSVILSLSVYQINVAQSARMYTMYGFFCSISMYGMYRYATGETTRPVEYVISTVLTIYTAYFAFLYVVAQNLFYANLWQGSGRVRVRQWLGTQVAVGVLALPAVYDTVNTLTTPSIGPGWWASFSVGKIIKFLWWISFIGIDENGLPINADLIANGLWAGLLLVLVGSFLFEGSVRRPNAVLESTRSILGGEKLRISFPLVWAFVPPAIMIAVSLTGRDVFVHRYVFPSTFGFVLLVSNGVANLRWDTFRQVTVSAIVLVLTYNVYRYFFTTMDLWTMPA